jgi:hypothetical protein
MNPTLRGTLLPLLTAFAAVSLSGCGSKRVVFVEATDQHMIRLGPDVRGHVYFWNGSSWEMSSSKVRLPEGWYAGFVSSTEEDN